MSSSTSSGREASTSVTAAAALLLPACRPVARAPALPALPTAALPTGPSLAAGVGSLSLSLTLLNCFMFWSCCVQSQVEACLLLQLTTWPPHGLRPAPKGDK